MGLGKTLILAKPRGHGVVRPVGPHGSAAFAHHRRGPNLAALVCSLIVTFALLGMMLLISGAAERAPPAADKLVLFAVTEIPAGDSELRQLKSVQQPEVFAYGPEEAAPASRPRTLTPAPALPIVPPAAINLASLDRPQVAIADEGPNVVAGASSIGDLAQGPSGRGGTGGDGIAGDGSGGAGSGKGSDSQLIASWAPTMDFSQNDQYFPRAARLAKVEGAAWLSCFVLRHERVRDCKLVAESPPGFGFGKAALMTQKGFRIRVHNQAGQRVYNEWVMVKSIFVLPNTKARSADSEAGHPEAQL